MESAQREDRRARRAVQHGRLLDSFSGEQDRTGESQGPAALDRRALQEQAGIFGANYFSSSETGGCRIPSRSGRAQTSRSRREGMGLCSKIELMGPHAAPGEQPKLPIPGVKNL